MIETNCLSQALYLLERAIRTRGFGLVIENKRTFHITDTHAKFSLSFMPGNRRVLVSHGTVVEKEYRNKGIGKRLAAVKQELAREAGCNLLLGTVRNDNFVQEHQMRKDGWERLLNRKTGVSLWGKQL